MFSTEPGAGPWTRFPQVLGEGMASGCGTFRQGNLQCVCEHLQPDPIGAAVAVGDQNKVRTAGAQRLPPALCRHECPRGSWSLAGLYLTSLREE